MRALLVGLLAFVLVTQAAAAAMQDSSTPRHARRAGEAARLTLDERLERKLAARSASTAAHPVLRRPPRALARPSTGRRRDRRSRMRSGACASSTKTIASLRAKMRARDARRLAALPPRAAICSVFGSALRGGRRGRLVRVAASTTAQNGQYLGLFQMGSYERRLFGHGASAHEQAVAAHRYFVRSGRDWSPWSCRWAAVVATDVFVANCGPTRLARGFRFAPSFW